MNAEQNEQSKDILFDILKLLREVKRARLAFVGWNILTSNPRLGLRT